MDVCSDVFTFDILFVRILTIRVLVDSCHDRDAGLLKTITEAAGATKQIYCG
jgi:hypothetical protein